MIQQQSVLRVSDNSGAKTARCIKVLGGFNKKTAKLGDVVVVSIQKLRNNSKISSKVKKGEIYKALLIRTKTKYKTKDGVIINFKDNSISLISKSGKPVPTRIIGPMPKLLKTEKFNKFTNLSSGLI